MKFYTPVNDDGRTILCKNQDDAKAISKKFESIDIPTDQAGLMAFAQEALDTAYELRQQLNRCEHEKSIAPVTIDAPRPSESLPAANPKILSSYEATDIEDFILNRASVGQVGNIMSCVATRLIEEARSHD